MKSQSTKPFDCPKLYKGHTFLKTDFYNLIYDVLLLRKFELRKMGKAEMFIFESVA